jgi:hypothetical protein
MFVVMKDSLYKGFVAAPGGFFAGVAYYFSSLCIGLPIILLVLPPILLLHLKLIDRGISIKKVDDEKINFWKIFVALVMPAVVFTFFYLGITLAKLLHQITTY